MNAFTDEYTSRPDSKAEEANVNREKVIVILHYYRDADKAIKMNERVIKNLEDQYYSTLGAVNSDGMPHGKGTTSNPVERVVLNIPGSVTRTIDRLRRENEETERVKAEIAEELKCLNYTEKALVLGFYINGEQWERLSARVNYSPRQCRNIRAVALDRLAKCFAVNKTISRYRFPENKIATHCPFFVVKLVLWKMNTTIRAGCGGKPPGRRKTDHVLNMARFLRASVGSREAKNEKQTKEAAAHGTRKKPGAGRSAPGMA